MNSLTVGDMKRSFYIENIIARSSRNQKGGDGNGGILAQHTLIDTAYKTFNFFFFLFCLYGEYKNLKVVAF